MSFPDSIRLDPIRLPRPTLRETSIYNINQYMSNLLPPKDMSIMPMALRYDPLAFPEHLRARRLGDINMSVADDKPSFHAVSSVSATDMNNMPANDWNPLSDSEARDDNSHNTSQYEESPLPQPTQQFQSHSMLMMSSALNNNFVMSKFLGYQRFIFILTKYPALVMAMVALWYTTGRGEGMPKSTAETYAIYSAMATAGIVLVSQIVLHTNHHYSYKKTRIMSYLYHVTMVAAFCTAVTCIVFAVINIGNIRKRTSAISCKYINAPCYSNHELLTYLAVLNGCSGIIIFFNLAAFIYGAIGGSQIERQRHTYEYETRSRPELYDNQAFQY